MVRVSGNIGRGYLCCCYCIGCESIGYGYLVFFGVGWVVGVFIWVNIW